MRSTHPFYSCFPAVVCAGRETEVAITPSDLSRAFREDRVYHVAVTGLDEDSLTFDVPIPLDHPCFVKNGCLHFVHRFETEQLYAIRFCEEGKGEVKLFLYAVEEDLYNRRPLKGDLHSHSYYSDGADCATVAPANFREAGFDFFALTDHNRYYPSQIAAKTYDGIPLGINIIPGEEIHTPGTILHIVHVGGKESVCNKYIHQPEVFEAEVSEIEKTLEHIPEQYRHRMALATWSCREAHKAGGLAIFSHPAWMPQRINVTREFCDLLLQAKMFDAMELMAGLSDKENNIQVALWVEQLLAGNGLPVVGSSDSHYLNSRDRDFGKRFSIVFAKDNSTEAILQAIREGYSVAGEVSPHEETNVRFYGSRLRLVKFAHFLQENYFTQTWRLCMAEGILMRRYAEGEAVGEVLAALAPTVENFYKRFYGITPIQDFSQKDLDYIEDCRNTHRTVGPQTCGSQLYILPHGRNKRTD
ncbi:MAG: hypothetical protein E7421_02990 [Ruminococcaceae bacterium]|nr:hypothetical protein [Oscillospiraceae bacterium]